CVLEGAVVGRAHDIALLAELTSPKSILTRKLLKLETYYRQILAEGGIICPDCGCWLPIRYYQHHEHPLPRFSPDLTHGIYIYCPACEDSDSASPWHLTLDTAVAQRFWRRHPRMRALPTQELDFAGRPALVTGFESLGESARLQLIQARDTYEILSVDGGVA